MTTPSHVHAAIEDLKARRVKIDAAISALEELFGVTPATPIEPSVASRPRQTRSKRNGHAADPSADAILAQLKGRGWTKPRDVATALDLNLAALRYHLKPLVKAKQVIAMGKTGARRIALAGTPKEAP